MKVIKEFKMYEETNIEIKNITLLDSIEYAKYKNIISNGSFWWLKDRNLYTDQINIVLPNGNISKEYVDGLNDVRPALIINSSNLLPKNIIHLFNYTWTVLDNNIILCDKAIAYMCFNEIYQPNINYNNSNIKEYLENWLKKQLTK